MPPTSASIEDLLGLAILHVNAGQRDRARVLCEQALAAHAPHPAVQQLLAVISLHEDDAAAATEWAAASLARRRDHAPTLRIAADAWFALSLKRHEAHDVAGEARKMFRKRGFLSNKIKARV